MATKEFIHDVLEYVKDNQSKLDFNNNIFEIMEGDLLSHVEASLRRQFNKEETVKVAIERAAPINIWNKIIKKLSKIYAAPRERITENPADQELVDYYIKRGIDKHLGNMNENYNSYKWSTVEIYEDKEEVQFRSVPSNQFIAYSNDPINPLRPTAHVKIMGAEKDIQGVTRNKYWIYTADEFIPVYENEEVVRDDLEGNDGVNPFGVLNFEYLAMSQYILTPNPDRDTYRMAVLIPILITDQNFGSMHLSFPIIYTMDADADNLPVSPNSVLNLKSDDPERKATIGVVKAEPDLAAQMKHTIEQLSIWLESRDINSTSIANMGSSNFPSGLSRAIAEIDTTENRKQQEVVFAEMETSFWKRLAQIHNTLAKVGRIKNRKLFTEPKDLEVTVIFPDEKIIESKSDKIARIKMELDAGVTSRRRAIQENNPRMNNDEVELLLAEILEERSSVIEIDEEEDAIN